MPSGMAWLSFIAGLLFMVLGARAAWEDYEAMRPLLHTEAYAPVAAKWLKVEVRADSGGSPADFYPDVLYEYFQEGKSVWGWRLSFEDLPQSKAYWLDRLKDYKVDDTVTAYLSPPDGKVAIIEKKNDGLWRPGLKVAIGLAFAAVGLVLTTIPVGAFLFRLKK